MFPKQRGVRNERNETSHYSRPGGSRNSHPHRPKKVAEVSHKSLSLTTFLNKFKAVIILFIPLVFFEQYSFITPTKDP